MAHIVEPYSILTMLAKFTLNEFCNRGNVLLQIDYGLLQLIYDEQV